MIAMVTPVLRAILAAVAFSGRILRTLAIFKTFSAIFLRVSSAAGGDREGR